MALKSVGRSEKSSQTKNIKEVTHDEASDEEYDDDELSPITKRFQHLIRKKNIFSGIRDDFKESNSGSKDQDGYYNYKKPGHYIVECPNLQKDKSRKESFQKKNFRSKFKKILMATWEELDNEEEDEEAKLALMASTFLESKDIKQVFSNHSKSDLSTLCHDLVERCQQKSRHIKTLKKQCDLLKDKLNLSKEELKNLKKNKFLQ